MQIKEKKETKLDLSVRPQRVTEAPAEENAKKKRVVVVTEF
jgi:hypothetical protein